MELWNFQNPISQYFALICTRLNWIYACQIQMQIKVVLQVTVEIYYTNLRKFILW